jgi:hypothetical protein
MNAMNVNRKLDQADPSFWDGVADAEPQTTTASGPWPQMDQLDLFCSGCAGRTWSHDCWEGGIPA